MLKFKFRCNLLDSVIRLHQLQHHIPLDEAGVVIVEEEQQRTDFLVGHEEQVGQQVGEVDVVDSSGAVGIVRGEHRPEVDGVFGALALELGEGGLEEDGAGCLLGGRQGVAEIRLTFGGAPEVPSVAEVLVLGLLLGEAGD